jgi:hyperosmotically inducible protein
MKNALVALVCTFGAVACGGESRPAANPSPAATSYTTETTTTSAPAATNAQRAPVSMTPAPGTPSTSTPAPATPQTDATSGSGMTTGTTTTAGAPPATNNPGAADNTKDATNTKINERDRNGTLTPMDQGGGKDRDITAAIRRAVMSDGSLSFTAKNVKIITTGGKVTLRGPVKSDAEKAAIESKAKSAPGVTEVDNQLEVKK